MSQPRHATYQPSRRTLVVPVVLGILAVAIAVLGLSGPDHAARLLVGAVDVPIATAAFVLARRGRVGGPMTVGSDGIVLRPIGQRDTVTIPWSDIDEIYVRHHLLERRVLVRTQDELEYTLTAPRDVPFSRDPEFDATVDNLQRWWATAGDRVAVTHSRDSARTIVVGFVLALLPLPLIVVVSQQAWNRAWWPGVDEATTLPDPCAVLEDAVSGPTGARQQDGGGDGRDAGCRWTDGGDPSTVVTLDYELVLRKAGPSSASEAAHTVRTWRDQQDRPDRIALAAGDESYRSASDAGGSGDGVQVTVLARRANVVVSVFVSAPGPEREVVTRATDAGQRALEAIELD